MKLKFNKGLNLRLEGDVQNFEPKEIKALNYAVAPDDFPGFMPKMCVREGDSVKVGTALMYDKNVPDVCLVSPVSGTVKAVVRGERRKILRVVLESDGRCEHEIFDTEVPLTGLLGKSGLFACIRRRPYDVVPQMDVVPRDIFVTALDTAPLAVSPVRMLCEDAGPILEKAVAALSSCTSGRVFLSVGHDWPFGQIGGSEMVVVSGPYPAGNVGMQVANIAPVNKGEDVWTLDVVTLYKIGSLLATGKVDSSVLVAVTGPEVGRPHVVKTRYGAEMASVVDGCIADDGRRKRIISGNVLTGVAVGSDGFLRFPGRQVTVIAEGDDVDEFMGWLPFRKSRGLCPPDARLHGGRRSMILSGEYEKVFPADIMVEYLLKAVMSRNVEDMEALGIYEVAPEDFALCEYVDTSKLPLQQIVRDGLDFMRKEIEW